MPAAIGPRRIEVPALSANQEQRSERRRTFRGALLASFAVFAAAAVALCWHKRTELAEILVAYGLSVQGIPAEFRVEDVGLHSLTLGPLRLGDSNAPEIRIKQVSVEFSWSGILAGRADLVDIAGLTIRLRIGPNGLELGSLAPLFGDSDAPTNPTDDVPVRRLVIRDLDADLEASNGMQIHTRGNMDLTLRPSLAGRLELELTGPGAHIEMTALPTGDLSRPELAISMDGQIDEDSPLPLKIPDRFKIEGTAMRNPQGRVLWEGQTKIASLTLPDALEIHQISLGAEGQDTDFELSFALGRVVDPDPESRFAPLEARGKLSGDFSTANLEMQASPIDGTASFVLEGPLDLRTATARLELDVPPFELGAAGTRATTLLPWLATTIEDATGEVAARGHLDVDGDGLRTEVEVALLGVNLTTPIGLVSELRGTVEVLGPTPVSTAPKQELAFAGVDGALPLGPGRIQFELTGDRIIRLEKAVFDLAGGELRASGNLPLDSENRTLDLLAQNLDLAQLIELADVAGLTGTGTLMGTLPLEQRGEDIHIADGLLRATGAGKIVYRPPNAAPLANQGTELAVLLGALDDFRYDALELRLAGDTDAALDLQIHISGANPTFQGGRRVELNVNVEAHLADLVRAARTGYRVPQVIEDRLRQTRKQREAAGEKP